MTDEITFTDKLTVDLIAQEGGDEFICRAARVSTLGSAAIESSESAGLIDYLLRSRHGSPFEHGFITFRIHAPIFVWREFMRHRIGFSYNEESGRYKKLEPVFYIPNKERKLVQTGKTGAYQFELGSEAQHRLMLNAFKASCSTAWNTYEFLLDSGIAKEVARMHLPVSTYSSVFVTTNPRALMSFLSLRTLYSAEEALFPSTPMYEISNVADQMEAHFKEYWPLTHASYVKAKRVAP